MSRLKYETLVRQAFGYKVNNKMIERMSDPALLANADIINFGNLSKAKIGAGYSMEIFISVLENSETIPNDDEGNRIEQFADRVLSVNNTNELLVLIDEFNTTVIEKYFNIDDGIIKLNK